MSGALVPQEGPLSTLRKGLVFIQCTPENWWFKYRLKVLIVEDNEPTLQGLPCAAPYAMNKTAVGRDGWKFPELGILRLRLAFEPKVGGAIYRGPAKMFLLLRMILQLDIMQWTTPQQATGYQQLATFANSRSKLRGIEPNFWLNSVPYPGAFIHGLLPLPRSPAS